ncbi:ATP-binding protein [Thaumasiovibrio subtropicus]|uniref:ATP-binding protein n=1 Tax=Thaumasiovibrio subtropicus TaxID=1891207 RepID=UPI000B34C774|nr:ATP-binding protein [Thaumasiovibrio subtropicus]
MDSDEKALLQRKIAREKAARKAAEQLLEEKSRELFDAQKLLQQHANQLKLRIDQSSAVIALQAHLESAVLRTSQKLLDQNLSSPIFADLVNNFTYRHVIPGCMLDIYETDERLLSGQFISGHFDYDPRDIMQGKRIGKRWIQRDDHFAYTLISGHRQFGVLACVIKVDGLLLSTVKKQIQILADMVCAAINRQLTLNNAIHDRERAEASEKSTRDFLAMINHELRSPLNGLLGGAELLDGTELDNEQQKLLDTINYSGELLRSVINDLLDYSKMNANMLQLINAPFSIAKLKEKLFGIFYIRASEQRIDFDIEIHPATPSYFFGDEDRIKQIFVNLIGNAIKFTETGHVKVQIRWQAPSLIFAVEDTGKGIKQEDIDKLFKPFSQVDNSSNREYEGTGLGLAICDKLAKQMQGSIKVKSEPDVGSTFTVAIQIPEHQETVEDKTQINVGSRRLSHLNVLVVEDLKTNQMIFNLMMGKLGIQPVVANNGEEALEVCDEDQFDLIFMDNRMPVMDGITATKILRSKGYDAPIVALTAGTTRTERDACFDAGVDDILSKPYQLTELKNIIEKWAL